MYEHYYMTEEEFIENLKNKGKDVINESFYSKLMDRLHMKFLNEKENLIHDEVVLIREVFEFCKNELNK